MAKTKKKITPLGNPNMDGQMIDIVTMKRLQKVMAEIGSKKKEGFIYMATTGGVPDKKGNVASEGVAFFYQSSPMEAIRNLMLNLEIPPHAVIGALLMDAVNNK